MDAKKELEKIVDKTMVEDEYYQGCEIPIFEGRGKWQKLKKMKLVQAVLDKLPELVEIDEDKTSVIIKEYLGQYLMSIPFSANSIAKAICEAKAKILRVRK